MKKKISGAKIVDLHPLNFSTPETRHLNPHLKPKLKECSNSLHTYSLLLTHPSNPPLTNNSCTAPPKSPTLTSHFSPPPTFPSPPFPSSTTTLLFFTSHLTFHPVRLVNAGSPSLYNFRSFFNNDGTSRQSSALLMELRLKMSPNDPATTMGILRL